MDFPSILAVLNSYKCLDNAVPTFKLFTDYDVVFVYNENDKLVGCFSDDILFANSVRYFSSNPHLIPNIFTPSIRCVIINYKDYLPNISISEVMERYSTRI